MTGPKWLDPLVANVAGIPVEMSKRGGAMAALQRVRAPRRAAVLIVFDGDPTSDTLPADATVLLLQRAPTLRQHSGQVSFPGGARDDTDYDDVAAALREAWEETGLDPATVEVVAVLDPIDVPVSGFVVVPVIGYSTNATNVHVVDPGETALVRRVPVAELVDPANRFMVRKTIYAAAVYRGPAFAVGPMLVWGFTGGLLNALLNAAGWEQPWNTDDVRSLTEEELAAQDRAASWQEGVR